MGQNDSPGLWGILEIGQGILMGKTSGWQEQGIPEGWGPLGQERGTSGPEGETSSSICLGGNVKTV